MITPADGMPLLNMCDAAWSSARCFLDSITKAKSSASLDFAVMIKQFYWERVAES